MPTLGRLISSTGYAPKMKNRYVAIKNSEEERIDHTSNWLGLAVVESLALAIGVIESCHILLIYIDQVILFYFNSCFNLCYTKKVSIK
jgi:hypothetical protein